MTTPSGAELTALMPGEAEGEVIVLVESLSLWGGFEPHTGELIDPHHPQRGEVLRGKILVMPSGRGSSSSSSVLAEAIRAGTAPAAIVLRERDTIILLGAIVARELYGHAVPVIVAGGRAYDALSSGERIKILATSDAVEVLAVDVLNE